MDDVEELFDAAETDKERAAITKQHMHDVIDEEPDIISLVGLNRCDGEVEVIGSLGGFGDEVIEGFEGYNEELVTSIAMALTQVESARYEINKQITGGMSRDHPITSDAAIGLFIGLFDNESAVLERAPQIFKDAFTPEDERPVDIEIGDEE